MNSAIAHRVDPIIKSHGAILAESNSLSSKVMYSLSCLQSAIEFQNANRTANINYLQSLVGCLIQLGENSKEISEDHLRCLIRLINSLLTEGNRLSPESEATLMSIITKVNAINGVMGEDLCHEIVSLCSKLKNQGETTKLLLQIMAQKMSPEQALRLIDSFRKNQLYNTEVYQLIKLGIHYNNNQQLLCRTIQGIHWQICNVLSTQKDASLQGKELVNFIKLTIGNNIHNVKVVSLCSLVYRQLVDSFKIIDKSTVSKSFDSFLRENGLKSAVRPYLVSSDKMISNFNQLSAILEAQLDVQQNRHLHYILNFYSSHQFQWREQLLSSVTNGKGSIAKQLLLRVTEHYSGMGRTTKAINEKDEVVYSNFLPIECLRSISSIYNKLQKDPSPHNALQIIGLYHSLDKTHPLFNDILLLLLEIYLKNKQFASLQQVQRIIKDEIPGDLVIRKLQEKGTIKNKDSNRQSKRYFICLPLVCSRSEVETVSDVLCEIFIHETIHIALKLYVADFTISKMILQPSKAFIVFLTRCINTNFSDDLLKMIFVYLEPHSVNHNPAVSQWFLKYFSDVTQKLVEFLFSKLIIPQIAYTAKILFLLEKFNLFGQAWMNSYRWILNSLEDFNEAYSDHTIDCLQIFEMIVQKITIGNIPETVVQRFEKIVLKNWEKYNQQHLFALDRIVTLLNEHSYIGFKEIALPSLEQLSQECLNVTKENFEKLDPLASYISKITFNIFFGHIDRQKAFQLLFKLIESLQQGKEGKKLITVKTALTLFNLLLFLFEGSEEAVDPKSDALVLLFLEKHWVQYLKVQEKCLEYLSRIPHSINILKLSLVDWTSQGFFNTIWLSDLTELLNIVSESKPKAIGSYKLQQVIKSMMVYLIASENKELIDSYMDFLQATCFIECDYQIVLDQSLSALQNALIAERCGVGYRKSLAQFSLGTLLDYEYNLNQELLWFLMSKYAFEPEIIGIILQYFEKFPIKNSILHEKLLMRVVLIHTQDEKIQLKSKELFKLHAPKSSNEQLLVENFANSNFTKCEQLIGQISNPYALIFSLSDVRSLLQWKNTAQKCKKLLSFLHSHPDNQIKIYQCEAFILNASYISYLSSLLEKIDTDPLVQKFQNQKKPFLILKRQQSLEILEKTLISIIKNKQLSLNLRSLLLETFKNREDDFAVLLKLILLIFSRQRKENRTNEQLKMFAKFWNQVCGQLELKDKSKAIKFALNNLNYIFPLFLSNAQIVSPFTPFTSILRHYQSVLIAFTVIQKQIGSSRYFLLLVGSVLQNSKNTDNKGAFVEQYLKTYLLLEGNQQLSLKQDDKSKYTDILLELNALVNKIAQAKTRDSSNKLESTFVNGFIAHLLFLLNQGVTLDIATFEIIKNTISNIDSLNCPQAQKEIIKQALEYLLKNVEKNLPLKAFQQKNQPKQPDRRPLEQQSYVSKRLYQSKKFNASSEPQIFSPTISKESPKRQNIQVIPEQYQSKKSEQDKKNQVMRQQQEQTYIKFKERQENVIIRQTITTNKTTIVVLNKPITATEELFNEQVQKPREQTFNEDKFYKVQAEPQQQTGPSDLERKNNLEKVQNIATGQLSIQSLKDHCKFISTLALLPKINQNEFTQLVASIQSINQTVSSHSFYVRKVCDFEISIKLVRIYKTMWRAGQKRNCENLVLEIIQLCLSMSKMKQRKLVLFSEQQIVQFFKMVVKRCLNSQGQQKEIQYLLQIIYNCRNNTQIYFTLGLLSMLIEVINRDRESVFQYVLEYFIKIQLTPQIINQIYQRGLFNKLIQSFSVTLANQSAKKILTLWIKLAGKVCINQSIQQKFRSKQLHMLVWSKIGELTKPNERKDITYFLAYMCLKNDAVTQWMIQAKVLEEILASLGQLTDNQELYLLFYHFCFGNLINRDYCIRIKYHLHLMSKLNQRWLEIKESTERYQLSKYFYKSLGQMMTSRHHASTFFKDQSIKKLIDIYNVKCEPSIFECLLDFISVLETDAQFDELKRQDFWDALKIFEFKISSEATYSYLLQIFLIMIKKGRTKEFSQAQLRNKVCLKAQFSINMQGKQLALRFILALSIKDKQNYLNERSVNLLASILGFKVSKNELQLAWDMLKVQGASKNQQFLRFFINANIHGLISDSLQKLTTQQLKIAYIILSTFSLHSEFIKFVASSFLPYVKRLIEKENGQTLNNLLQILNLCSQNKQNKDIFSFLDIENNIDNEVIRGKAKEKDCQKQIQRFLKNIEKLKGIAVVQSNNQDKLKKAVTSLRQGRKVKMYKVDGSISELFIYISSDCLQLNCGLSLSEVVKQKWRLPLNEIIKVVDYYSQESNQFKSSYFEKNSGFFSKAPFYQTCLSLIGKNNQFHVCFPSGQKQFWKANLQLAREYARNLLSNFGQK